MYGDELIYGSEKYTKKSDTTEYYGASTSTGNQQYPWRRKVVVLFETSLMAKLWLISKSTLTSKIYKLPSLADEKKADFLINKCKYRFKRLNTGTSDKDYEQPHLFEFIICEYDEVNKCLK
jgi:hypothetical protein